MGFLKKYWYFSLITIITFGLGIVTFITSQQLTKTTPVAPNVPQVTPKAAEPACTLSFNLATPTPTDAITPTITNTPTETPANTNTPTPTHTVGCNNGCTVNADCDNGLVCSDGYCRNGSCTEQTDCTCNQAQATPTPVLSDCNSGCTVNADCSNGLVCIDNSCRNASCTEKTNCSCDVAAATPKTPVAGIGPSVLGVSVIGSAFLLILLGLAL